MGIIDKYAFVYYLNFKGDKMGILGDVLKGAAVIAGVWGAKKAYDYFTDDEDELEKDDDYPISKLSAYMVMILAKGAIADGRVNKKEIEFFEEMLDSLEYDFEQKEFARYLFDTSKNSKDSSIYDIASLLEEEISLLEDDELREICYCKLLLMMVVDGDLTEKEKTILMTIPEYLGLDNEEMYEEYLNDLDEDNEQEEEENNCLEDSYKILGCTSSSTEAEIKKAYRQKVKSYHPDTISSKELAPEFIEFANNQMQKITQAYEVIREARGF
jgi:DnaJ like chaperone protein